MPRGRASFPRPGGIAVGKQDRGHVRVQKARPKTHARRLESRMKKRLSLVLLPALLVGSLSPARAQTSEGPPSGKGDAERAEARAELERKALGLLGEALAAAQELKLAENRVRAQVTAARLLWPRDAAAGREAFKAAADGI